MELAAKETPVELTTWLQEGGADLEEEDADLEEGGLLVVVGADLFEVVGEDLLWVVLVWGDFGLDFLANSFQAFDASAGSRPGT